MRPQADEFRRVLGHFCTGVTVITTSGPPLAGFACQAFAALSLAPPLVLFYRGRYAATDPGTGPTEVVDTLLAWPHHDDWM